MDQKVFQETTVADLCRIQGERPPHLEVESELERLGGGVWEGFAFKNLVLKAAGYDVDHPPSDQQKVNAYNLIATALNSLAVSRTRSKLCDLMGI